MGVIVVENLQQFQEIIKQDSYSVFDFWATWCGPCRQISPIFEKLSETATDVTFYKVDVDAVPDVAQEVGIRAMPTFVLFKGGEKVKEIVGANPPALQSLVQRPAEAKA